MTQLEIFILNYFTRTDKDNSSNVNIDINVDLGISIKKIVNILNEKKSTYGAIRKRVTRNMRRNINSDISIVTIRRVPITFLEMRMVKNFMQKF